MGFFFLVLGIVIIAFAGVIIIDYQWQWDLDWLEFFCLPVGIIGTIILAICLFCGIAAHTNVDAKYQAHLIWIEATQNQIDNIDMYDEDIVSTVKYDIYKTALEWNTELVRSQGLSNNPWFSWFYEPFWNDLPMIEINENFYQPQTSIP